jgi:hypothetical protein
MDNEKNKVVSITLLPHKKVDKLFLPSSCLFCFKSKETEALNPWQGTGKEN